VAIHGSVLIRATNSQNLCFLRKLSSAEISALLNTNPKRICDSGLCALCVSAFLNWMPFTDGTACPFLERQRRRERGEFLIVNQALRFELEMTAAWYLRNNNLVKLTLCQESVSVIAGICRTQL